MILPHATPYEKEQTVLKIGIAGLRGSLDNLAVVKTNASVILSVYSSSHDPFIHASVTMRNSGQSYVLRE